MFKIPSKGNKSIMFTEWSNDWQNNMPVRFIHYPNGLMDIHCQTGDHHIKAINKAKDILRLLGYIVVDSDCSLGCTGMYYSVESMWKILIKNYTKRIYDYTRIIKPSNRN